jgi:RNA polymerase sigma factor (sigma-70 family)
MRGQSVSIRSGAGLFAAGANGNSRESVTAVRGEGGFAGETVSRKVAYRKTADRAEWAHARSMANPADTAFHTTDVEMLARAASAGDPAALNALLTAVRPEILRLCGRFLSNREDAEEACQDTLWAVARGIGSFHGRSAFRTWMHSLAANRARSAYQAIRRRHHGEATGTPLPDRADPRRTSMVAATRLDLLEALDGLPADYAEAAALRDVLGLSYADIAALLDVPEGTVKSRIHEARRRLRLSLNDHR